jgi:hypothetical protein
LQTGIDSGQPEDEVICPSGKPRRPTFAGATSECTSPAITDEARRRIILTLFHPAGYCR